MGVSTGVGVRYRSLQPFLDERAKRLLAAAESHAIEHGGITTVSKAMGISPAAIRRGIAELKGSSSLPLGRVRLPGGGRKKLVDKDPTLQADLEALLESTTGGNPEVPLRWTTKSTRELAADLKRLNHTVSHHVVAALLHRLGYALQPNRRTCEAATYAGRTAQLSYLNTKIASYLARQQPVISVEIGTSGSIENWADWGDVSRQIPTPEDEQPQLKSRSAIRSAMAGPARSRDRVSWANDQDTAGFAVDTIRRWWLIMGKPLYPEANTLYITTGEVDSSSPGSRLWITGLQQFASETRLDLSVSHLPPVTCKWIKIEHRMLASLTQHSPAKPLRKVDVLVNVIGRATTTEGFKQEHRPKSKSDQAAAWLSSDRLSSAWNYEVYPAKHEDSENLISRHIPSKL